MLVVATAGCGLGSKGPYVWACTPANYNSGGNTDGAVFVYNGSMANANVAVKLLNKNGTNLAGIPVVGAPPGTVYPGQTGTNTVIVAPDNTLIVKWITAKGDPAVGANIPATVKIVSDQPIVVGSNIEFSGFHPMICASTRP